MKKKAALLAAFLILLAILAANSAAYDTDSTTAHNVITTDGVDITVVYQRMEGSSPVNVSSGEIAVVPGREYSRIATVRNDGAASYIRAHVEILFKDAQGNRMVLTDQKIRQTVSLDQNSADWLTKEGDGYWVYYKAPVNTANSTTPLFTKVAFDAEKMGNEFQSSKIEIIVTAQAVQTANNGTGVMAAEGWPG